MRDPEDQIDSRDDGEDDEPEPEEDVDLLVDNVQWQHTESVVTLVGAAGSKLVKTAFGDLKQKLSLSISGNNFAVYHES